MSLQLPPELAATAQGFLVGGRFKNDEEVLREALVALKEREDDLACVLEGIEDEAAGRIVLARDVLTRAKRSLDGPPA